MNPISHQMEGIILPLKPTNETICVHATTGTTYTCVHKILQTYVATCAMLFPKRLAFTFETKFSIYKLRLFRIHDML